MTMIEPFPMVTVVIQGHVLLWYRNIKHAQLRPVREGFSSVNTLRFWTHNLKKKIFRVIGVSSVVKCTVDFRSTYYTLNCYKVFKLFRLIEYNEALGNKGGELGQHRFSDWTTRYCGSCATFSWKASQMVIWHENRLNDMRSLFCSFVVVFIVIVGVNLL